MTKDATLSIRLSAATLAALDALALATERTRSWHAEKAVVAYLKAVGPPAAKPATRKK